MCGQNELKDIKIRVSNLPGRCRQVDLMKFIVPHDADLARRIFIGLVQVYMSDKNFEVFQLHDSMINGCNRSKYCALMPFWKEVGFQRNPAGMLLPCFNFRKHRGDISPPRYFVVDEDDYREIMGHTQASIDAHFSMLESEIRSRMLVSEENVDFEGMPDLVDPSYWDDEQDITDVCDGKLDELFK